ncbi:hypothetical protein THRCLA_21335 [Thraustotheca clavata]|uniref:NADAR domain-containing protein n=1 Tax=Thraustotheca clavata TaxID=74557 RepID=A0A1V9ZXK9_9STRA|nr:hypothetical protein THRCLA_21335 [Thraustotheca clavata]
MSKENNKVLLFHSRAKDKRGKILSNFSSHAVTVEGETYPTVEHAFQAYKYMYSNNPSFSKVFTTNGNIGKAKPEHAKRAGSKGGMKKRGAVLDVLKWNANSYQVAELLIQAKVNQHEDVAKVVKEAREDGILLVHFSRNDMKWGAVYDHENECIKRGENLLGNIYLQVKVDKDGGTKEV